MKKSNGVGVDSAKENRLATLKNDLEKQMRLVRDERDVEKINLIVEKMEKIEPTKLTSTDEERFQSFKDDYFTNAVAEHDEFNRICQHESNNFNYEKPAYSRRFPKLGFAAIITIVLLSVSSTVIMAAFGVFNPIIKWTNETLNKSYSNDGSTVESNLDKEVSIDESDYSEIEKEQSVLILKPNYLPKGFQLSSIEKDETEFQTNYNVIYTNGDEDISYVLKFRIKGQVSSNSEIEITSEDREEITLNDIQYYIFKNNNWYGATWNHLNVDYNIVGFETKEEILKFIENLKI